MNPAVNFSPTSGGVDELAGGRGTACGRTASTLVGCAFAQRGARARNRGARNALGLAGRVQAATHRRAGKAKVKFCESLTLGLYYASNNSSVLVVYTTTVGVLASMHTYA